MIQPARRMDQVQGQPMFGLLARAQEMERAGRDMVHFELGDTNFDTPADVKAAVVEALDRNQTHYAAPSGRYEIKRAAMQVTARSRGFTPAESQLLVTPGANMQIYLALAVACDPGDAVAIPVPYFPSYVAQVCALGLKIVLYDSVEALCKMQPKAIILNSPNNPTGKVLSENDIEAVYRSANASDALLISDEVYSRMIYKGTFFSPSVYDHCRERTVVVNGFSKSFAMSGWRLGVMTGPENIIKKCTVLLETILSCVPPFIQMAGAKALLGMQEETKNMRANLEVRRLLMWNGLNSLKGVKCEEPEGGLYCWANIEDTRLSAKEYADKAMVVGVVLSPGTFFGQEGFVRLCYGCSEEDIKKGIERLRGI